MTNNLKRNDPWRDFADIVQPLRYEYNIAYTPDEAADRLREYFNRTQGDSFWANSHQRVELETIGGGGYAFRITRDAILMNAGVDGTLQAGDHNTTNITCVIAPPLQRPTLIFFVVVALAFGWLLGGGVTATSAACLTQFLVAAGFLSTVIVPRLFIRDSLVSELNIALSSIPKIVRDF